MICPKCGHEASGNYCNNCGAPLYSDDAYYLDDPLTLEEDGFDQFSYEDRESDWMEIDLQAYTKPQEEIQAPFRYKEPGNEEKNVKKPKEKKEVKKKPEKKVEKTAERNTDRTAVKKIEKNERRLNERKAAIKNSEPRSSESAQIKKTEKPAGNHFRPIRGRGKREIGDPVIQMESRRRRTQDLPYLEPQQNQEQPYQSQPYQDQQRDQHQETGFMDKAVKGIQGTLVICSRLMQIVSVLLMVSMTAAMAWSFWKNREGLGSARMILEEENYGLALYLGFAGISLFMGMIWSFWTLSRKAAGGGVRLKKYDTGRGFIPFLLCAAVVFAAEPVNRLLPSLLSEWKGISEGASAALTAVIQHREQLLFCSALGAALSFIRKILSV